MQDYVSEITSFTWLFGPSNSVFSHLNTEIEGRFGIPEPIRWPFRYSLADSVAASVFSVRFGILTHRPAPWVGYKTFLVKIVPPGLEI